MAHSRPCRGTTQCQTRAATQPACPAAASSPTVPTAAQTITMAQGSASKAARPSQISPVVVQRQNAPRNPYVPKPQAVARPPDRLIRRPHIPSNDQSRRPDHWSATAATRASKFDAARVRARGAPSRGGSRWIRYLAGGSTRRHCRGLAPSSTSGRRPRSASMAASSSKRASTPRPTSQICRGCRSVSRTRGPAADSRESRFRGRSASHRRPQRPSWT